MNYTITLMIVTYKVKEVLFDMEQNTSNEYEISNQQSNDIKGTVSQTPHRRVPYMEIVGQVHGTYIIAQNENGMFMIDQHVLRKELNMNILEKNWK